ncbi:MULTISPECIES: hypothetical protein [unclassified Acinetobacter]|uniref:hypothetical protein n=1 Tax=unclassified Acinetobacter TaxID=196816 RepID=UPI0004479560|nr:MULTISPECIES: hypothetical protein [unclassified Acinetobacter]EZQ10391.1 hypothetical protein CL42_07680 [Acinetobacter sp. Ver3]
MSAKVVLIDLENNMPTSTLFREIVQHYTTTYLFHSKGSFHYSLTDLTEFASWISSGQIVILEMLEAKEKEFEYAVIVGQILALVEHGAEIDVISARDCSTMLADMMRASGIQCNLIQVQPEQPVSKLKYNVPSVETIRQNHDLFKVKQYCDVVVRMEGKPNTLAKLKNSIENTLRINDEHSAKLIGMLINLKVVKKEGEQISFRKKVLKQWAQLDMNVDEDVVADHKLGQVDALLAKLHIEAKDILAEIEESQDIQHIQSDLFKNFEKIDPVQLEVIQKLNALKSGKPKDIYELRDLLEQLFPKSDVRLLLKEMIDKGYIYWNGHEVLYSHEMFLN